MPITLGINHQFLYPASMTDEAAHTASLREVIKLRGVDAIDAWIWRGEARAAEEIAILRDCGKIVNYNSGDRFGEEPFMPAHPDPAVRQRTIDRYLREFDYALRLGCKKIVVGSGPDYPDDREAAIERYVETMCCLLRQLPEDVIVTLEPTDRDIDRFYLFGKVAETADCIHAVRAAGCTNFGMLLDMGHIPLMHETFESSIAGLGDTLDHLHIASCLLDDPNHPLYGDKHIAWGEPGSIYTPEDGITFLRMIRAQKPEYFARPDCTVTFEMRTMTGCDPQQTVDRLLATWAEAFPDS